MTECDEGSPARFKNLSGGFCALDEADDLEPEPGEPAELHSSRFIECAQKYSKAAPWFLPAAAQGNDYSGSLVDRSNQQELLNACAELDEESELCRPWFVALHGSYGGFGIALHALRTPDEIVEILEKLEDHPVVDEDALSELEREMEDEAWESWAEREYRDALERAFAESDESGVDIEVDASEVDGGDLRDHLDQWSDETGTYWETEGQGRTINLDRIAQAAAAAGYPPDGLLIRPTYEAEGEDVASDDPDLQELAARELAKRLRRGPPQLNGALGDLDESLLAQGWVVVALTVLVQHAVEIEGLAQLTTSQVQTVHRGRPSRYGPIAVVLAAFPDVQPALRYVAVVHGLPFVVDLVVTRYEGGYYEYYVDGRWRPVPPHGPDDREPLNGLSAGPQFAVGDRVYYAGPRPWFCDPGETPEQWAGYYVVVAVDEADQQVTIENDEVTVIAEMMQVSRIEPGRLGNVAGGAPAVGNVIEVDGLGEAIEFATLGRVVDDRRVLRSRIQQRRANVLPRLRSALEKARARRQVRAKACQLEGELERAKSKAKQRKCKADAREDVLEALDRLQSERAAIKEMVARARTMVSGRGRKGGLRAQELRRESDDQVRNDLNDNAELVALWDRTKHKIRASKRRSRTEAFLEWVEDHPEALDEMRAEQEQQWAREAEELLRNAPANDVEAADEDLEAAALLLDELERRQTAVPF